tara:strand:- start:86 stop:682 length:597 start_codon:yes stop_codon:yes gene_type:complete
MINLRSRSSIKITLGLIVCFSFFSCQKNERHEYFYSMKYNNETEASRYQVLSVKIKDDSISFERKYYGDSLNYKYSRYDYFLLFEGGLEKVEGNIRAPYLDIRNRDCVTYTYEDPALNDMLSSELCFLGRENIEVNGVVFKEAFKFLKTIGITHSTESIIYFDNNFIPLYEAYVSGYREPFLMERIDQLPLALTCPLR